VAECRRWKSTLAFAMLASLLLSACDDRLESFGGATMGSTYTVKYVRGADGPSPRQLQREVETLFADIDRQMSTYRDDSLISRFNALEQGCMTLPPPMLQLSDYGERLSRDSGGAFDMTVMPLTQLWGFGTQAQPNHVPTQQQIDDVQKYVGHQHLWREDEKLCKDAPVRLSFDSIAAGYAVDLTVELLARLGIHSYMVEITGELKAAGRKPDGSPWRIAIEAPQQDQRIASMIVQLDGHGISTSGDYRNYFEENGRRYSHTFDARSGRPIEHNLAAVTVIDRSTLEADGLSTLLLALGPEQGYRFAIEHGLAALFVTREAQGFHSHATPLFEQLVGVKK